MLNDIIPSLLIANRGEIACRIIRTARRLGIRTIAVYSDADAHAAHVTMADEAVCIGASEAVHSYLNSEAVMAAVRETGAKALHPGYGFLSERPELVEACMREGMIFVGPPASAMRMLGLKDQAKAYAQALGIPVVPGYHGAEQSLDVLSEHALKIGFPLLIKAVAGGGGKGMKRVDALTNLSDALSSAQREAQSAFGDPRVLLEKYIIAPRHIEMQIFADTHGHVVHLFERDCSLQRRHQKVIEEAPAPDLPLNVRHAMADVAIKLAKQVGYVGAGTVEFIVDASDPLDENSFYFLEMNTRLQVEHTVTEMITGLDLVEWQLRVAAGEPLPLMQDAIQCQGHAVEARLYAENVVNGFLPSIGQLNAFGLPQGEGIRVETGMRQGDVISPYYDPMLAKIIAQGSTRHEALNRLSTALSQTWALGVTTNAPFLKALVDHPDFQKGACTTGFIMTHYDSLVEQGKPCLDHAACLGALALLFPEQRAADSLSPWAQCDAFQLSAPRVQHIPLDVAGTRRQVTLFWPNQSSHHGMCHVTCGEFALRFSICTPREALHHVPVIKELDGVHVIMGGVPVKVMFERPAQSTTIEISANQVISPMHGKITAIEVIAGQSVIKGQRLAVVEAMKMEHVLTAPCDGVVSDILIHVDDQVKQGAQIMTFATPD